MSHQDNVFLLQDTYYTFASTQSVFVKLTYKENELCIKIESIYFADHPRKELGDKENWN